MKTFNENEKDRINFKNIVLPLYNNNWKTPGKTGGFTKEFVDAVESHVKEFGEYQLWNFLGEADGSLPEWWDSSKHEVKKELF